MIIKSFVSFKKGMHVCKNKLKKPHSFRLFHYYSDVINRP